MYRVTTLVNGLRVATHTMPQVESVSVGIWVGVGARFEPPSLSGVSHFIEHMLFKGTRNRTARQISEAVESIGGYLNAFTSEESSCFYAKAAHNHLARLLDVLSDMYLHPLFEQKDIEKERTIIRDEIMMVRDAPVQYVHELLSETMWPDQPLGHPVTGTVETIGNLTKTRIVRYKRQKYLPSNTIVAVAGRCWHDDAVESVETAFQKFANASSPPKFLPAVNRQRGARIRLLTKETEQSHLALGVLAYSRHNPKRHALRLLSIILGENASSRLFQVVRERYGLAYSIQSATACFSDTGAFLIEAGLDNRRLTHSLRVIMRELRRIARKPPTEDEVTRAKNYALGQLKLGLENSTNQMMWMGEQLLSYGRIFEPSEIARNIEAVTAQDVASVAAELFTPKRWNLALIGPCKDRRQIVSALHWD